MTWPSRWRPSENVVTGKIPLVAVDKGFVTILAKGGIPKKVAVKLGVVDGTWAEVTDQSVQPGDTLILPGK